jgi:alkylation response protein AidB-like acyl-CoA dehydrogenase
VLGARFQVMRASWLTLHSNRNTGTFSAKPFSRRSPSGTNRAVSSPHSARTNPDTMMSLASASLHSREARCTVEADRLLTDSALATAKAQSAISDLALDAASGIFDTGGGSATSRTLNVDRHWRNIRTLLAHNPIDYKLKVIGENALSGRSPPLSGGFF